MVVLVPTGGQAPRLSFWILDGVFATKTREQWMEHFARTNAPFAYSPIHRWADLFKDEQALANRYVVPFEHPVLGPVHMPGFPIDFSDCPQYIRRQAPEYGEHTEEVLMGVLGMSWDDMVRLKDQEVIR